MSEWNDLEVFTKNKIRKRKQMQQFDVVKDVNYKLKNDKETLLNSFKNSVAREVKKIKISHKLETRPFKFKDGETADVSKKLTIVIDFADSVVQPHSHFEDDFCTSIVEALAENINGLYENAG